MKRLLIIFFSIVLLASCQKDDRVNALEETVVTYKVQPSVSFEVKSPGEATAINVLWYGVYHKKANGEYKGEYKYMNDMSAFVEVTDPANIQVPITLIKGQEYKLVFVAQHRIQSANDDNVYTYTVNEDGLMTLNTEAKITSGEQLDAFIYVDTVGPIVGNENKNIVLERPVAQINVATSATELPQTLDLTLEGMPKSYNVFTETYSEEKTTLALTAQKPIGGQLEVGNTKYNRLSTVYVFGGNKINCTIQYGTTTRTISNIDTAPNHKTNIVGNI